MKKTDKKNHEFEKQGVNGSYFFQKRKIKVEISRRQRTFFVEAKGKKNPSGICVPEGLRLFGFETLPQVVKDLSLIGKPEGSLNCVVKPFELLRKS